MESADFLYQEMISSPVVFTTLFHDVLAALEEEGTNESALAHMKELLNVPVNGYPEWEVNAR